MGLKELANKIFPAAIADDENYVGDIYENDDYVEEESRGAVETYSSRGANVTVATGGSSIEMKVVSPKSYDAVTQIADLLVSKKTVLLNLENTNRETARRLIDFLSGAAYAIGGGVQKVADNTYAITPSNVAVSKESMSNAVEEEQTENAGMSF